MDGDSKMKSDVLNAVIIQQQRRIDELEQKFRASENEILRLKKSVMGYEKSLSLGKSQPAEGTRKVRSSSNCLEKPRYWTREEHERFLVAREKLGAKNYSAIAEYVQTRSAKQVRTHAQKYEMRLARDKTQRSSTPAHSPSPPSASTLTVPLSSASLPESSMSVPETSTSNVQSGSSGPDMIGSTSVTSSLVFTPNVFGADGFDAVIDFDADMSHSSTPYTSPLLPQKEHPEFDHNWIDQDETGLFMKENIS